MTAWQSEEVFDLEAEMERLLSLPVFAGGPLTERRPALKVRRASKKPNRLGFAVPSRWRLSVTAYPGAARCDLEETLLHELVHLHVGEEPGKRRWHGKVFRKTLHRAMQQAYGVAIPMPPNTLHGTYAVAIESARQPEQLTLPLAA